MNDIAYETGGQAVFGSNDLTGALRRSIEDGSNYYTIAYRPENHDWNGKFRVIKVEMAGHNYSLSYRRGYFAYPDQITNEDAAQALNTALQPGTPQSTLLLLKGKVDLPDATHPETFVETTVDPASVEFTSDGNGHTLVSSASTSTRQPTRRPSKRGSAFSRTSGLPTSTRNVVLPDDMLASELLTVEDITVPRPQSRSCVIRQCKYLFLDLSNLGV